MIKLTLKSIWEQKGINLSAAFLLSLVFSVQLLLCAWLEGFLNIDNEYLNAVNSLRLMFTLLILVSVTSNITRRRPTRSLRNSSSNWTAGNVVFQA